MKKFLALVLALVMTMSLVTISAGAEDFTDDSKITYEEAVDVMTAVGVVGGYADGSFNPTAGLTRGAAAKIICNMLLGPTTAEALVCNEAPFSDVAVDNVFAGYIAYCVNEGIISGYADGTFKPAAPLTGYAFMKMLLGALGYDAAIEGYVGSNWSIAVAKRALNIELDKGLVGEFSGAKALTREEACLYAFNALNSSMVKYDNKSTITIGDVVISQNSEAKVVATGEAGLFRTQYFKKLDKVAAGDPSVDAFGRPAYTWMNGKDEIGTYADTADYVVVLDDTYANEAKLTEALQDLTGNTKLVAKTGAATYVNGDAAANYDAAKYGTVVELFCNDEDNGNLVTSVVAYYYTVDKIVGVDDDVTKADAKKDVTCYVDFDVAGEYNDIDVVGFDAATYVKDAYVALIVNEAGEIIDSFIPEVAEGSLTTVKGNDYVTMDGTKYYAVAALGMDFSGLKTGADNSYKLFLDANGNIIGTKVVDEAAADIDEVYYVALTWNEDANKYNESGKKAYFAQLVAMDGTVSEVELEQAYSGLEGKLVTISDKKYTESGVTYKADNDKFDLKAWSNADFDVLTVANYAGWTFKKDMTRFTLGNGTTFRFNNDTVYVLVENTGRDLDAAVKVGGIALTGTSAMKGFVITEDGKSVAKYVVIANPAADIEETNTFDAENLVYIKALSTEKGEGYRVQTVYGVDGKETTLKVDEDEYSALEAGKFYAVDTNDDGFYVLSADAADVKVLDVEAANNVWDDEEGVLVGVKYVGMFETLLSVEGAVDVETADAAFADLHDTEVGYAKTVKTLSALKALFDKEGYTTDATLALNVTEDGAVTIFVTALTHTKTAE